MTSVSLLLILTTIAVISLLLSASMNQACIVLEVYIAVLGWFPCPPMYFWLVCCYISALLWYT